MSPVLEPEVLSFDVLELVASELFPFGKLGVPNVGLFTVPGIAGTLPIPLILLKVLEPTEGGEEP